MVCVQVFTLASHISDFFGPGLLESALAPSAGLCERILLLIWMPPSSSSACSFCPEISPLLAPWGSGECRTSVQKRVRGPWSSQKWQRATIAFIARAQHIRRGLLQMSEKTHNLNTNWHKNSCQTPPGPAGCECWFMSFQELLSQSVQHNSTLGRANSSGLDRTGPEQDNHPAHGHLRLCWDGTGQDRCFCAQPSLKASMQVCLGQTDGTA